jgi:hypothetical protein
MVATVADMAPGLDPRIEEQGGGTKKGGGGSRVGDDGAPWMQPVLTGVV